jgi:putative transposase
MPWRRTSVMDERTKFVGRLLAGEKIAPLCREFGISRVTGHKIWSRYQQNGSTGLYNLSRAPHKHPNQTPFEVEQLIVRLKREKPSWGAPKIRELVSRKYPTIKLPSTSTVHCILARHELVTKRRKRNPFPATATYLSTPEQPNDLWCVDFKGEFRMRNENYCYPLTISDFVSRYLFTCEALEGTRERPCFSIFEEAFQEYGLPSAIRSDNGIPFASGNSTWNMTRLSVWWMRLGIKLERIEPGNPQQNGRHERMHRTLKLEATQPRDNLLQQQEGFDRFRERFNHERPHQALGMKCPGEVHQPSSRPYRGLPDLTYPGFDRTLLISNCGRVLLKKLKIHVSKALSNQPVGVKQVDQGIWQVDFMSYTIGYFDEESRKFSPNQDPFGLHFN